MEFIPEIAFDNNSAQNTVWLAVKQAFQDEEGLAYYRYPLYRQDGIMRHEPDVMLVFRRYGIFVIECKSFGINNIESIQGNVWQMKGWYREVEQPLAQASDQMFAFKNYLESQPSLNNSLSYHHYAVLPFVSKGEWESSGFAQLPTTNAVLLNEDLKPDVFHQWLINVSKKKPQQSLSEDQWMILKSSLGSSSGATADSNGKLQILRYTGGPPIEQLIRESIELTDQDTGEEVPYTYIVATMALQARRGNKEGFGQRHQRKDGPADSSEVLLVFHNAIRHFMNRPLLTRAEERVLLQRSIKRVTAEDGAMGIQLRQDLFAWMQALADVDELGWDLTDGIPDGLADKLVHPRVGTILQALQREYRRQQAEFAGNKSTFEAMAYKYLQEDYRPTPIVIMEGFTFLTDLQKLFIERCLSQGAKVWMIQPYRPEQEHGFEIMDLTYENYIDEDSLEVIETRSSADESDLELAKYNLFSSDKGSIAPLSDGTVQGCVYAHRNQEVAQCITQIKKYLNNEEIKPRDIAIVVRSPADFKPLLQEESELQGLPDAFEIPPRHLLLTPLGRFALSIYEIWDEEKLSMTADQFESIIASGWLGALVQKTTDSFGAVKAQVFARCDDETSWKENLTQLRLLIDELDPGSRLPAASVSVDDIENWESSINSLKTLCSRLFDGEERSIGEHIERLLDELEQLDKNLILKYELEVVERIWAILLEMVESESIRVTKSEFGDVLSSLVRERREGEEEEEVEQSESKILITTPEGIDSSSKSIVFFLGLDDQHAPRTYVDPWPIYDQKINEHQAKERYLFLAVIRAAQQHLHISYSKTDGEQIYRPSIYLEELVSIVGISLSELYDGIENEEVFVEDRNEEGPVEDRNEVNSGQAFRDSYSVDELAHYQLCPFRYKLEHLDAKSRRYKSMWQIRFLAQGMWYQLMLKKMVEQSIRSTGQDELRENMLSVKDEAEPDIKRIFPGLRPLDWVTINRYANKQIEWWVAQHANEDYSLEVHESERATITVRNDDRVVQVNATSRYGFKRGRFRWPIDSDMLHEHWLLPGVNPGNGESPLKEVDGTDVFTEQYHAVQWWKGVVENAYYYRYKEDLLPKKIAETGPKYIATEENLQTTIEIVQTGLYPKNPGHHCHYCPAKGECLGLNP